AYQWRLQGMDVAGATASTLSLTNARYSDGGDYTVLVSNLAGSTTSAVATLTVLSPPAITQPPHDLTLSQGTDALFSVTALGTPPLSYEWRFNQAGGLGATGSLFTRSNAQCGAAGTYDVVITNAYGSVTSSPAVLTVVAPPQMILQPS